MIQSEPSEGFAHSRHIMRLAKPVIIVLAIAALYFFVWPVVRSCWVMYELVSAGDTLPPRVLRTRLTVVVETPEGERSGSSVTQLTTRFPGGITKAQGYATWPTLVGDAVVVDLGSRGLFFTTFESKSGLARGGTDIYNAAFAPFPPTRFRGDTSSGKDTYVAYLDELISEKPKGDLQIKDLPVLVRFSDPSNSASVELVDPSRLAANFGSGVTFKSATIEVTDDPITTGFVESKLPWLASSKEAPLLIPPKRVLRTNDQVPPVENLRYTDFRRFPVRPAT